VANLISTKNVHCYLTKLVRFVYAKYGSDYMSEVCHFVTQKVTTAKSVQTTPLLKLQNLFKFGQYYLKKLQKIS